MAITLPEDLRIKLSRLGGAQWVRSAIAEAAAPGERAAATLNYNCTLTPEAWTKFKKLGGNRWLTQALRDADDPKYHA